MINPPGITPQIGGYLLDFTEIAVKVGRLDTHKDGRVTGELTITNSSKAILLPPSTFNFSADRTRAITARALAEKYPDTKVNWVELFDYLGYKIQELARQGEPVIEVWVDDEAEKPEFLLEPFIYKNQSNIIYGEKGVSKSTLAYTMGMCMALPWHDNPLELVVPDRPIVTLVLDWETDEKTFAYYLSRLKRGMNIPTVPMYYRKCQQPLSEELEAIQQFIQDHNIDILLIDSMAAAAGGENGELKGAQSALSFNTALRKLNRTSLIIGQTSKDMTGKKTIFGSTMFTYYARNIFELCRNEDMDKDSVHLAMFHRECNLGRKHKPIGFCLHFDDDNNSISINRESVTVSEFVNKVSATNAVADALKSGLKTVKEICAITGLKDSVVRTYAGRLVEKGKVVKVGDRWGLKSYHQDDMEF
uniref:Putative ATPase domain containing protein n=1 Tax=viral metagenome TaxID=1070528 RepID=A0A6M3LMW3_9ZZZZ